MVVLPIFVIILVVLRLFAVVLHVFVGMFVVVIHLFLVVLGLCGCFGTAGQTAAGGGGGGGVERIQVMFTPTICKVRCSQDRCVNYCERGNVTTLYSSAEGGGRRDGAHGPGFRVCKSSVHAEDLRSS
uniref:Uncharacterized protein n=1 Tax=Stegastes partitus TaxID=144197 RepID=A0A3B5AZZ0_9TELE